MDYILQSLREDWHALLQLAPRLAYAAVLIALVLLAGRYLGRLTVRVLRRGDRPSADAQLLQSLVLLLSGAVAVLLALGVLGLQGVAASILATGGIVAIVLGFAFREIGENFLAGFFLTFSRPFERGDLIRTGELTGTVRSIELRYVHIRSADACDVYVPSARIFREPLHNYTRDGLRRPSFTIGVAYHDAPDAVLERLRVATESVGGVLEEPAPAIAVRAFSDAVVHYEVFFWVDVARSKRSLLDYENAVKMACWRTLRQAGMTFSSDVTSAIEVKSAPPLAVDVSGTTRQPG